MHVMVASVWMSKKGIQVTLHPQTRLQFTQYMSQKVHALTSNCGSQTKSHAVPTSVKRIYRIFYFLLFLQNLDPEGELILKMKIRFHFNLVTDFQKTLRGIVFMHLDFYV